jgi:surfactin synthase thioesterase subunit
VKPWLVRLGTGTKSAAEPPRLRVVALPHAGGWPSAFITWRKVLPGHVELMVGQLPGRGARNDEPPMRRVAPLVEGLSAALEELEPLPYAVLGHSFGSVLAYELTRAMERNGDPPRVLAVSARQPPCFRSKAPYAHRQTDDELRDHLIGMGGLPRELTWRTDLLGMALKAVRADLEALEMYERPPSGTSVPILALGASDDPVVIAARLHLWALETSGTFEQVMFEGGHFHLYEAGVAERIARELMTRLDVPPASQGLRQKAS